MTGIIELRDTRDLDAARKDEYGAKIDDAKSRREVIEQGVEKAFSEAEREDDLEGSLEVQKKVEERFGASAGDVLAHFQGLDAEMRQDPVAGLAKAEEFFLKTAHRPVTTLKDLRPANDRHRDKLLSEVGAGNDVRADVAKSFARAIETQEAATRLKEAAKGIKGPVKNALQRVLDVTELGATNPQLAAAQWFSTTSFPSKSDLDQPAPEPGVYWALDHLLENEFKDLEPHVTKITQMVQSGEFRPSGDLRVDMKNARKLLKRRA